MVKWRYIIPACVLLIVAAGLAVRHGSMGERVESDREMSDGVTTAENARSTQRSSTIKKTMASHEAFDRLWEMGVEELNMRVSEKDLNVSRVSLLAEIEENYKKHDEIRTLLKLINYDQAKRLFAKFHLNYNETNLRRDIEPVSGAIAMGAFTKMSELNVEKSLVVFDQEPDENVRNLLARLLATGWSKAHPSEALNWWREYASERPDFVVRASQLNPFAYTVDHHLYAALSKVDYQSAFEIAKSERDDLIRVNAMIGLVKGLPHGAPIEQIAERCLAEVPENKQNDFSWEDGKYHLQQAITLKWVETDFGKALIWYKAQLGTDKDPFLESDYVLEEDIDGDPFGSGEKLVERWVDEHPASFLAWVESRGNIDHYPTILDHYYGGQHTDRAMDFIARQKNAKLRRDLFRKVLMREAIGVSLTGGDPFSGVPMDQADNMSEVMRVYDQGASHLERSQLPDADKKELKIWLKAERAKWEK